MNAKDMIRIAEAARQQRFADGLKDLIERTGLRPGATFRAVEGSDFIRPVLIVEPVPGWEGPPTQEEDKHEEIAPKGPN